MMTSSNGNIFRVTGLLCGEFTGPGEFPAQRPVTRSFDVFFALRLNKWLSKQPRGWWIETPSWSLWRHRNDIKIPVTLAIMIVMFPWKSTFYWYFFVSSKMLIKYLSLYYPTLGCDIQGFGAMGLSVQYWPRWFQDFRRSDWLCHSEQMGPIWGYVPCQKKYFLCVK